jgi:hypothetical protein
MRTKDELAIETARLQPAVCLGNLLEGDPLGDARPDGANFQATEEPFKVVSEPVRMLRAH